MNHICTIHCNTLAGLSVAEEPRLEKGYRKDNRSFGQLGNRDFTTCFINFEFSTYTQINLLVQTNSGVIVDLTNVVKIGEKQPNIAVTPSETTRISSTKRR